MSRSKRWYSIAIGGGLAALLLAGILAVVPAVAQGPGGMRGGFNPGWMMGNHPHHGDPSFGPGWMMGGGMHGLVGGSMMVHSNSPFFATEPLTLAETVETLNSYLATLNDSNLAAEDLMIFENHAYAQIVEKDSGLGVMELLIDPTTKVVYPEMGPNMIWNLKYGMMSGYGRYGLMGGRSGSGNFTPAEPPAEMPISPSEAVTRAQTHLDTFFSKANLTADQHADPFYGYYTLHVKRDGETVGMLSINGFTGQAFPHTWHGKLLEMAGE